MLVSANAFAEGGDILFLPDVVVPNACVYQNIGSYEDDVIMVPVYEDIIYKCVPGRYLPVGATECAICPENSYCSGGSFVYDENQSQGISVCADGLVAPEGTKSVAGCGKILHVGADIIYLTQEKQVEPSLVVKVDDVLFYGKMAPLKNEEKPKPMNKNAEKSLMVQMGETKYYVYDDTVVE